MANELVLSPAQVPQYAANVDLSPNVVETGYSAQRARSAAIAHDHGAVAVQQGERVSLNMTVVDRAVVGGRRWRRWDDL